MTKTNRLTDDEARVLGSSQIFVDTAAMVRCNTDMPCTFLVAKTDGFKCPDCGDYFCSTHMPRHHCPARKDREKQEWSQYRADLWDTGKLTWDMTDRTLIEAERYFGFGPLYHIKRGGRWYYYRFNHITLWRNSNGPHWTVWAYRTDKTGESELGYSHLEMEHLTEIEFVSAEPAKCA